MYLRKQDLSDHLRKYVRNFASGGSYSLLRPDAATFLSHVGVYSRPEHATFVQSCVHSNLNVNVYRKPRMSLVIISLNMFGISPPRGSHNLLWSDATTFLGHSGVYQLPQHATFACGPRRQCIISHKSLLPPETSDHPI